MPTKQELRKMTCCFTGHRDIPDQNRREIAAKLEEAVNYTGQGHKDVLA